MKLHYHLPRPDLRDFVRAYYLFETEERTLQPMSAELGNIRCLLAGGGRFIMPDGSSAPFAAATLIGPTMGSYVIDAEAGTRAFGAGILPRGWQALLGVDAGELADKVVDFTALAGRAARATGEEIRNARDLAGMAAAADRFFSSLLDHRMRGRGLYPKALERWLVNPNDLDIDALVAMMDVSRRQIDRVSKQYFGASPKVLQRKYRALRAADRILFEGARNWMDAAGPSFYDQSHFIKEFRAFVGATPKAFAENHAALVSAIRSRRHDETVQHPFSAL